MSNESYATRLERINKLTKKREDRGMTRSELAAETGLSSARIREIERGAEVTGGEAKDICKALNTWWSEIWVNQDGMIVVREKKGSSWGSSCHCKL